MVVNLPLGQKLIIGSTFENGFEATLTLKSNVLRAEGGGGGGLTSEFLFFFQRLGGKVKAVFWESEAKHSKLCRAKVSHSKHFRK